MQERIDKVLCPGDPEKNTGAAPYNLNFDQDDIFAQAFQPQESPETISYFVVEDTDPKGTLNFVIYRANSSSELSIEGMLDVANALYPDKINNQSKIVGGGVYSVAAKRTLPFQREYKIANQSLQDCIDHAFEENK